MLVAAPSAAQNLIPNGGFEEYSECPPTWGYVERAVPWQNRRQSPDFFHSCNTGINAGVPFNSLGYQYPAQGDGYAGIATYDVNNAYMREIMGVELPAPLTIGQPIWLAFKVAVGGFGSWNGSSAKYTCKGVGMKFFIHVPADPQEWIEYLWAGYPNDAALSLQVVPTDTAIWYSVSGVYVPDSAYTHLLIANFFADSLSSPTLLDSTGFSNTSWSYAYIDEVCASYDPADCGIVQELQEPEGVRSAYAANPFGEELIVHLLSAARQSLRVELLDSRGRLVLQHPVAPGALSFRLPLPALPDGLFILTMRDEHGPYKPLRLIHQSP